MPRRSDAHAPLLARAFGDALRAADPAAAENVALEGLRIGMAPADVHSLVIAPAMHWIGQLWELDAISVADEHLATAISHSVLALLYPSLLRRPPRSGPRVVVAAVQGEQHVLGSRMTADVLEGEGYDVCFLGADVPNAALVEMVERLQAQAVALTVTLPGHAAVLDELLPALRGLEPAPVILLGGGGVPPKLRVAPGVFYAGASREAADALDALLTPRRTSAGAAGPAQREEPRVRTPWPLVEGPSSAALAAADIARAQARRAFVLADLAFRDSLTGLANRRAYDDRARELADGGGDHAVVLLDVDDFKAVNDTLGHAAGDRVLVDLAAAITSCVRPGDLAARIGGDEFAVLLPDTGISEARWVGERICRALHGAGPPPIHASVGVAHLGDDRRAAAMAADAALYEAKRAGGDRVSVAV